MNSLNEVKEVSYQTGLQEKIMFAYVCMLYLNHSKAHIVILCKLFKLFRVTRWLWGCCIYKN